MNTGPSLINKRGVVGFLLVYYDLCEKLQCNSISCTDYYTDAHLYYHFLKKHLKCKNTFHCILLIACQQCQNKRWDIKWGNLVHNAIQSVIVSIFSITYFCYDRPCLSSYSILGFDLLNGRSQPEYYHSFLRPQPEVLLCRDTGPVTAFIYICCHPNNHWQRVACHI